MSPTLFRARGYRFFFFSREETRMHVHVAHAEGEAKYWLEPEIELARYVGLNARALKEAEALVREHAQQIMEAWHVHFPR